MEGCNTALCPGVQVLAGRHFASEQWLPFMEEFASSFTAFPWSMNCGSMNCATTTDESSDQTPRTQRSDNNAEFVPRFLARREKAKEAASRKTATAPKGTSSTKHPMAPPGNGTISTPIATAAAAAAAAPKPLPTALSALPQSFHKRYLMNFTVLSPEQQRAAQEAARAEQRRDAEEGTHRRGGGRQGHRGGGSRMAGWGGNAGALGSHDYGKAALRELTRRGVLEREGVKAMLAPGPLQDFRGSVLQVGVVLVGEDAGLAMWCTRTTAVHA